MSDTLRVGESLSGDARITSNNGQYHFGVLPDGNVAVGGPDGAEWDLGVHDAEGARLDMQADGNLVLYRPDGSPRWGSDTSAQNAQLTPPACPPRSPAGPVPRTPPRRPDAIGVAGSARHPVRSGEHDLAELRRR